MSTVEAGKILGVGCKIEETKDTANAERKQHQDIFAGELADGKITNLYYMFERYANEALAVKTFGGFRDGNRNSPGFIFLNDVGDEAFYHTDNEGFALIVARKSDRMIRIKVNKLTARTSKADMHLVAKDIISRTNK